MRLFIALELPDKVKQVLGRLMTGVARECGVQQYSGFQPGGRTPASFRKAAMTR